MSSCYSFMAEESSGSGRDQKPAACNSALDHHRLPTTQTISPLLFHLFDLKRIPAELSEPCQHCRDLMSTTSLPASA